MKYVFPKSKNKKANVTVCLNGDDKEKETFEVKLPNCRNSQFFIKFKNCKVIGIEARKACL